MVLSSTPHLAHEQQAASMRHRIQPSIGQRHLFAVGLDVGLQFGKVVAMSKSSLNYVVLHDLTLMPPSGMVWEKGQERSFGVWGRRRGCCLAGL